MSLNRKRVVVTGIGCVAPGGLDTDSFWDAIKAGRAEVGNVTLFDADPYPCHVAGEVKGLDIYKYVTQKKAREVHRVVPIALAAADQALKDSGLMEHPLKEDLGEVIGTGANGLSYYEYQTGHLNQYGLKRVSPHTITATFVGMLSSEISLAYGLHGTSQVISNGCTSASDAIGYAFNLIRFGLSDVLMTGGAESSLSPMIFASFSRMGALSTKYNDQPARASRPFNLDRDGFVFGEGAWIFIFEEMEHAKKRGARIYAEIKGFGSTNDAYHKTSPEPSGLYLARAMEVAIQDAGLVKTEIDYINLHGTSTPVNDRVETAAIKRCFGEGAYSIPASSLKSMVGHPQGASGALGVAGTVMAIQSGFIPPTINYENPDPECDLDYVPNEGRTMDLENCMVNSIGFGSKNTCLIVSKFRE